MKVGGWGGSHTISGSDRRLEEGMFIQSSDPIFHDPQNKRLALYGQTGSFQLSRVRTFVENTGLCFSHCLKCLSLLHLPLMDEQLGKRNSMNNHCLVVLSDGSGVTCRSTPSLRQSFSSHPNCGRDEQLSETGPNSSGMFPCHRPGPGHSTIHV